MSQVRAREREASSPANPEIQSAAQENPLQLLRDAIEQLKSSNGHLPDQAQVADLLAEAREALERANAVAGALRQCDGFVNEAKFDQALEVVDAGLLVYPADPALVTRRAEVLEQQKAFHTAAVVRSAIDEADFLLDQDRVDLAVQFLQERVSELPDQDELTSRLQEVQSLVPYWEQKREVHAAVARAASLEQLEQWQASLTVLQVALQSYPSSEELIEAARRVQARMVEHEREKKLARRLEQIRQKMAEQSWRPAINLLERTHKEFPSTPELVALDREARAGLKRAECQAAITEVQQFLADGEFTQAQLILGKALASLGPEPALEALEKELESDRKYRTALETAQVHFGRRQLNDAERILTDLLAPNRPEAQALLDAVRRARAASEEEDFCERGRLKALGLIQEQQFAQAADLLRNLLSLFPGNQILERDLAVTERALKDAAAEIAQCAAVMTSAPAPEPAVQVAPAASGAVREVVPSRLRRVAIAGTASLVLASGAGAVWKFSGSAASASKPDAKPQAYVPAATPAPAASVSPIESAATTSGAPPAEPPRESTPETAAPQVTAQQVPSANAPRERSSKMPVRQFVPVETRKNRVGAQETPLPTPPSAGQLASAPAPATSDVVQFVSNTVPAPAPPPPPKSAVSPAAPPAKAPIPSGGRIRAAQLIDHPMPEYPTLARDLNASGRVRLTAQVDEKGAVKNVVVLSGHPVLAAAARNAVLRWRYVPATLNDKAIATQVQIEISFGSGK